MTLIKELNIFFIKLFCEFKSLIYLKALIKYIKDLNKY